MQFVMLLAFGPRQDSERPALRAAKPRASAARQWVVPEVAPACVVARLASCVLRLASCVSRLTHSAPRAPRPAPRVADYVFTRCAARRVAHVRA
jgi:hypothetical protein